MARRTRKGLLALALLTSAVLPVIAAVPSVAVTSAPSSVDVCIKVSTDLRAPYADGTCPAGFALKQIALVETGEAVCVKVKTDWRAPYNNGTCPAGFELLLLQTDPEFGQKACFKPSTDVRAPYNSGACPSGFAVRFLSPVIVIIG